MATYRRILVPIGGSATSEQALQKTIKPMHPLRHPLTGDNHDHYTDRA